MNMRPMYLAIYSPSSFLSLSLFEVVPPTSLLRPSRTSLPLHKGGPKGGFALELLLFCRGYTFMWTRFNGLTFISYQGRFYREAGEAIYLGEKSRKADPS